jgi:hypothetical protein
MNDQPNMSHDELAALFTRNMTLQQLAAAQPMEEPKPEPEPIIYSITQHYTHSAHISREPEPEPESEMMTDRERHSSEPPQTQQPSAELILRNHGVDPTALSPSQIDLFKTAEDSQKLRLIELWRICPPTNTHDSPAVAWASTTVEQEEMLTQLRYEKKLEEDSQQQNVMSLDGTPLTPVQTDDSSWHAISYMEPYMMSGYEAMARREYEESTRRQYAEAMSRPKEVYSHFGSAVGDYRPATDPVYNRNNNWLRQQQAMENQYGAYQMEM